MGAPSDVAGYPTPDFRFKQNDKINFNIGNLKLPTTLASSNVTLFDIFNTHHINNEIINLVRLLLVIDTNSGTILKDPASFNFINIPDEYVNSSMDIYITSDDLKLSPVEFEASPNAQRFLKTFKKSGFASGQDASDYFNKVMRTARLLCSYMHPTMGPAIGHYKSCDDADGDGVSNSLDKFPWNADESTDNNNDGLGDDQNRTYTDLAIPNVANGFTFNQKSGQLYISHSAAKSVSVVDVVSGAVIKTFQFDYQPNRMALSRDGKLLYVALLTHEYNAYLDLDHQSGYVGIIDTDSLQQTKIFNVKIDPYDLAATENDGLVISPGSGQSSELVLYDTKTEKLLAKSPNMSVYSHGFINFNEDDKLLHYISSGGGLKQFQITESAIIPIDSVSGNISATFLKNSNIPGKDTLVSVGGLFYSAITGAVDKNVQMPFGMQSIAYDSNTNQAYTLTAGNNINYYNLDTLQKSGQIAFNPMGGYGSTGLLWIIGSNYEKIDSIYVFNKNLYVVHIKIDGSLQLIKIPEPCLYCATSKAPIAQMAVSQTRQTYSQITFDASTSMDAEDGSSLSYRWDIDGDEKWDSDFSTNHVTKYTFITEGDKNIKLQVKDSSGLINNITQKITVASAEYEGVAPKSKIFSELAIPISYVLHDKENKKAYVTSMYNQKMYVVDLTTGSVEREFEFEFQPARMAMSADHKTVYVALVMGDNSTQWYQEDQKGIVVAFDTTKQAFVHGFDIKTDPFDMILNSLGQLVITSGSGQSGKIYLYDPATGNSPGDLGYVYQQSRFAIATQDVLQYKYPEQALDVIEHDGIYYITYSDLSFNGELMWATPDKKNIIKNTGNVETAVDQKAAGSLNTSIENLFFETDRNLLFTLSYYKGNIKYYSMDNYQLLGTIPFDLTGSWIIAQDDKISIFSQESNFVSALTQLPHPCVACGKNTSFADPVN
jgi:hypothetical protein